MPGTVDRAALLARHSPRLAAIDPRSPMQIGNGNFAFTADVTGLQTIPDAYPVSEGDGHGDGPGRVIGTLLGTMSSWGWHTVPYAPSPAEPPSIDVSLRDYDVSLPPVGGGSWRTVREGVPYVDLAQEQWGGLTGEPDPREEWLRNNPHRLDLGRVGLWMAGGVTASDIRDVDQRLDLATGLLTSQFAVRDSRFTVVTAVHPERDELAVQVRRNGDDEPFGAVLAFPYGSEDWGNSQDWTRPEAHTTVVRDCADGYLISRRLDATEYAVAVAADTPAALERDNDPHRLILRATCDDLSFTATFAPDPNPAMQAEARAQRPACAAHTPERRPLPETSAAVLDATREHWADFWTSGAAISFDGTEDARAAELERRVVLSQYLTAINCSGTTPPAETGLMLNSWRGKFHLEMHWWHAAHFPMWGRPELLTPALDWYLSITDKAREMAERQGYEGLRWPKQIDPSGTETPSSIGTFLIWQQPHPIAMLEHVYQALLRGDAEAQATELLERFLPVIEGTADFMAAFAVLDEADGRYHLAAPVIPAQESYARERRTTADPTFELAYWRFGLLTASAWVERAGRPVPTLWREVADGLFTPVPRDGLYPSIAVEPYVIRTDHPGMLGALGVVPDVGMLDHNVMSATLDDVTSGWDWESTWGWDYPMGAMTATRLGRPDVAIDWLLVGKGKNEYLVNGHNYQTPGLPIYLPGNGGLLAAVALMASERAFPESWNVQSDGFVARDA
jgi:hypothetical protein